MKRDLDKCVAGEETDNHKLVRVDQEVSVVDASKLMRKTGSTELLVTHEANHLPLPIGIVTANQIVTRVIAAELDPAVLTMGDIVWSEMQAVDDEDTPTAI